MKQALGLFLLCQIVSRVNGQDLSDLYSRVSPSIVSITCTETVTGATRYGTGFFVSPDGVLITNHHVIYDATEIAIKDYRGVEWTDTHVVEVDEVHDLAAIRAVGCSSQPLRIAERGEFKIGQRVVAIGNPLGLESTMSDGIISAIRVVPEKKIGEIVQVTAPISPGSSGGPLLTLSGRVIGATTFTTTIGQNLNFVMPVQSFARVLLHEKGLHQVPVVGETFKPKATPDLIDQAKRSEAAGNRQMAKEIYSSVLRADPLNRQALLGICEVYVKEWDHYNANRVLQKYLAIDSANARAYVLQGTILERQAQTRLAIEAFGKAVSLDDSLTLARFELLKLLSAAGRKQEAMVHLESLKEMDPQLYQRAKFILEGR